jgi:7-cyano-7-deazaguanine synthase in queuosine biosynthesis
LNSGGIDSLALATFLKDHELHSLHVHQGHPSSDAQALSAERIAAKYCVSHEVVELHGLRQNPKENGIVRAVAYQSPILSVIGSSFAFSKGIVSVVSGNRIEYLSEDFEPAFLKMMQTHTKDERIFSRPLGKISFEDVYQIVKNDPLLPQTVSCLSLPRCGICLKCLNRTKFNID